jgi:hypothetical protein
MPHPVVYPGNFDALLKEWDERYKQAWKEHGRDGLNSLMIANGECARLPQELTNVGWTGRWQPGERVVDVARSIKPGTVIANFLLRDGKWVFPNIHGYHAALFMHGDGFSVATGAPNRIWMFDQWRGDRPKWPSPRPVTVWPKGAATAKLPCDRGEDFYVVLVP